MQFEIGEGDNYDLPHGLEKAIQKMEKSEESVFYLKPKYAVSDLLVLQYKLTYLSISTKYLAR